MGAHVRRAMGPAPGDARSSGLRVVPEAAISRTMGPLQCGGPARAAGVVAVVATSRAAGVSTMQRREQRLARVAEEQGLGESGTNSALRRPNVAQWGHIAPSSLAVVWPCWAQGRTWQR